MGNMKLAVESSVPKNESRVETFDPVLASLFASSVSLKFVMGSAKESRRANGLDSRLARYNLPTNDTYPSDHPPTFLLPKIWKRPLLNLKLRLVWLRKQRMTIFQHKTMATLLKLAV